MPNRAITRRDPSRATATIASALIAALLISAHAQSALAIGTGFSYQGQLKKSGAPYTGNADLVFSLYSSSTGGLPLATVTLNAQPVAAGLFTVPLDFGSVFDGTARWMEIRTSTNGEPLTTLTPRQEIKSAPYAVRSTFAENGTSGGSQWITNGSSIYYNLGKVGIGTANPTTKLHVNSGTEDINAGYFENDDPDYPCFFTRNYAVNGWGYYDDTSDRHHLAGTLGIGTTTPEAKLHVVGDRYGVKGKGSAGSGIAGIGVWGVGDGSVFTGQGIGVYGESDFGTGVYGTTSDDFWYGGYFTNTGGGTALRVDGLADVRSLRILGGADIVEGFEARGEAGASEKPEPGTVLVIDETRAGELRTSTAPYDPKVAGVVSGANGISHGMKLGQDGALDGETLVAMTGRVYVKCSTENGAIRPGDLLTTSGTSGHAMRATDHTLANGAVIGKAMSSLDVRSGLVLVLVNLQ